MVMAKSSGVVVSFLMIQKTSGNLDIASDLSIGVMDMFQRCLMLLLFWQEKLS